MNAHKPVGFATLLEKMPRRFVARFKRVEERAKRRREAQAQRFSEEVSRTVTVRDPGQNEWLDTLADFTTRAGEELGAP